MAEDTKYDEDKFLTLLKTSLESTIFYLVDNGPNNGSSALAKSVVEAVKLPETRPFIAKAIEKAFPSKDNECDPCAWGERGNFYEELGYPANAIECYYNALKLSPSLRLGYLGERIRFLRRITQNHFLEHWDYIDPSTYHQWRGINGNGHNGHRHIFPDEIPPTYRLE